MSGKNFMSYGDADTILTEFSNDIKSRVSTKANQGLTSQQIANAKANIDIEKVPNVATNDQTPTFLEESSRVNIASGDKLSLIFGKIKKFFSDLKTVAFSGSYNDLSNTPDLSLKANWTTITIPVFTPSQAGWRRICKITTPGSAGTGLIYVGGYWSNGAPASALLSVSTLHSVASLTLLSSKSPSGIIKSIRLVYNSPNQFWVDVYFPAYSSGTGPHTLKFTGDITISDIQNPISITTDTTAVAEISLNQTVSGTVLTDGGTTLGSSVSLNSYSSSTNKYTVPNDGYVTAYAGSGTGFNVYLDSVNGGTEVIKISSADGYNRQSIFVKKSMKVYGYPTSGSSYQFNYYPLQ